MKKDNLLNHKFRSKVKHNGNHLFSGDWVYGSLIIKSNGIFIYVIEYDDFGNLIREFDVEVLPETVGQFTGRNDVNDVEVYDGSIITNENTGELQEVFWNNEKSAWYCRYLDENHIVSLSDSLGNLNFVTGNIHEN